MTNVKQILSTRVNGLIGPGKPFRSPSDMAQKAMNRGLVANAESFTRSINRVREGLKDVQLSTIDIIAKTADLEAADLLVESTEISGGALEAATLLMQLSSDKQRAALSMLRGLVSDSKDNLPLPDAFVIGSPAVRFEPDLTLVSGSSEMQVQLKRIDAAAGMLETIMEAIREEAESLAAADRGFDNPEKDAAVQIASTRYNSLKRLIQQTRAAASKALVESTGTDDAERRDPNH